MSSTADSIKKQAEEVALDGPNAKRAKLNDEKSEESGKNNVAVILDNNNGSSTSADKTSSKTLNGGDKNVEDVDSEALDDESGNQEGVFDPKIATFLEKAESIQLEIGNLNEKASEEILKVEQRFNKLRRPHFEKRNELLREIPNFWLTTLANHPTIAPMIESHEDEDCLQYMVNLDVEDYDDIKSGYKLNLHFAENPYITNDVIVKEFQILSSDEVVSSCSPIQYKNTQQGQSLKNIVEDSIKQNARRTGRPIGQIQSFFGWLVEPSESGADEVAEILKDQIFPNPLDYYLATPEDYGNGPDDDDESDDDDEEIDEEEIDDDEDIEGEIEDSSIEGEVESSEEED